MRLDLCLDAAYPEIVEDAAAAVRLTALAAHVGRRRVTGTRCVRVTCYWRGWPAVFPQHGPGRKLALAAWQRPIVNQHPQWFLRATLDSFVGPKA